MCVSLPALFFHTCHWISSWIANMHLVESAIFFTTDDITWRAANKINSPSVNAVLSPEKESISTLDPSMNNFSTNYCCLTVFFQ